jgi:TM2 domain-containing membrane protein YozV
MRQQQYITGPGMSSKSKIVAGLFGIFFGGFGVHNFYLGKSGRAVIQLLLTCIGWVIFGLGPIASIIWGLVEGIEILGSHPGSPWHTDGNNLQLQDWIRSLPIISTAAVIGGDSRR